MTRKWGKIGHLGGFCQPRVNLVFLADAKKILRLAHPHIFCGGKDPVFPKVFKGEERNGWL
ncbi:MAG: hypothetical protein ACKO57_09115, partial [Alphaproteobacteria bacterium]